MKAPRQIDPALAQLADAILIPPFPEHEAPPWILAALGLMAARQLREPAARRTASLKKAGVAVTPSSRPCSPRCRA